VGILSAGDRAEKKEEVLQKIQDGEALQKVSGQLLSIISPAR